MRANSSKQRCPALCLFDLSYNVKFHWSCRVGGCYSHLTASGSRQGFPGVDHEGHQDCVVKAKLSIFKAVFVPILTYGHESWVMTERMRSQVQASEMRFLRRIEGVTLFNKVRSSEIRKSLNIEPLLLRIERSQLRWFGHVSRMPQERLPKQALHAKANGRRPVGRPRTRWTDYIEDLGWNSLGLRPSEMMEVMEDREVWRLNLELLPLQPSRKSGQ